MCFGHELVGLRHHEERVEASVVGCRAGRGRCRPRYVVAADGAHSTVRSLLGIGMEGPDELAVYERVEFTAVSTKRSVSVATPSTS